MLKQRVITALILGPFIIWSVLTFSHAALAIEMGIILVLAAWEWAKLSGIQNQFGRVGYGIFVAGTLLLSAWLMHAHTVQLEVILYAAAVWWCLALLLIILANRTKVSAVASFSNLAILGNLLFGVVVLFGAFVSIVGVHRFEEYGARYILLLLILIWAADSSAYFAGKAFGKHKLAANVSPGKTWEGVAGGVLATAIVAYIISVYLQLENPFNFYFVTIAIITVGFSIVGDLIESLFKRRAGVKDSSQLLPGHGGVLDRIDSLLSAAPLFLLGLLMVGIK